jgi:pimeloyl-ACP methyl ester carboxylesterase
VQASRHIVTVNGRAVHYRRAGTGPPMALLHESPGSSVALLPLKKLLAEGKRQAARIALADAPAGERVGKATAEPAPHAVAAAIARAFDGR